MIVNFWTQKNHLMSDGDSLDFYNIAEEDRKRLVLPISLPCLLKIQTFVDQCDKEISGLGEIKELTAGGFEINQPFILEQEVSSVNTDQTEAAAKFVFELAQKGASPAPFKFWWHSHADMGVFWSGEDEDTARGFGNIYMFSMVINKRRELLTRFDQFEPIRLTIYNISVLITLPKNKKLIEQCKEEIENKVRTWHYRQPKKRGFFSNLSDLFSSGQPKIIEPEAEPAVITRQPNSVAPEKPVVPEPAEEEKVEAKDDGKEKTK